MLYTVARLHHTALHTTVLHCYYTALYCSTLLLHCPLLFYLDTTLNFTVLHCYYTALYSSELLCSTLHCYYIELFFTALYCTKHLLIYPIFPCINLLCTIFCSQLYCSALLLNCTIIISLTFLFTFTVL